MCSIPNETPVYLGSWKGRVIKSIAVEGARTWNELRDSTGLSPNKLNLVLKELFSAGAMYKTDHGEYRVQKDLYKQYQSYFQAQQKEKAALPQVRISEKVQKDLPIWIDTWKAAKRLEIDLKNKHFYLEGRFLDDFSKEVIANAQAEVLVVNPWIKDCDLSDTIREPAQKNASVTVIARPTDDEDALKYQQILQQAGVKIYNNKKVHAKVIVVDRALAIVSSMNFIVQSSGGQSWEAGLVTIDPNVVEDVVNSILNLLERPDSEER